MATIKDLSATVQLVDKLALTKAFTELKSYLDTKAGDTSALNRLENYACAAYNMTSRHIAAVNALTSVEEVEAYDFERFYPEKLTFEVTEMM